MFVYLPISPTKTEPIRSFVFCFLNQLLVILKPFSFYFYWHSFLYSSCQNMRQISLVCYVINRFKISNLRMKWNLSWNLPSLISCKSWSLRRIFSKFGFWSPSMFSTGHASPSIRKLKSPIQNTELYWPIISSRKDTDLEIRKIKQTLKEKGKKEMEKSWHKLNQKYLKDFWNQILL